MSAACVRVPDLRRSGAVAVPRRRLRCAAAAEATVEAVPASHAFGFYVFGGGEGVRGALVDTASGAFVGEGMSTELSSASPEALVAAVVKLVTAAKWSGPIGVGLPGRVQARRLPSPPDASARADGRSLGARRTLAACPRRTGRQGARREPRWSGCWRLPQAARPSA